MCGSGKEVNNKEYTLIYVYRNYYVAHNVYKMFKHHSKHSKDLAESASIEINKIKVVIN